MACSWLLSKMTYQPSHNKSHEEEQRVVKVNRCDEEYEQVCLR